MKTQPSNQPLIAICLGIMAVLTITSTILRSVATAQAAKPYLLYFQLDLQSYDDHHVTGTLIKLNKQDESGRDDSTTHMVLDCDRPLVRDGVVDGFSARLDSPYVLKIKTRERGSSDSVEATCKF